MGFVDFSGFGLLGFGGLVLEEAATPAGVGGSGAAGGLAGVRWEVEGGDLEAVEEETGATGVDLVGGDATEDLADGELDSGAVFGEGEVEGGFGWCGRGGFGEGFARFAVVEAEGFAAEGPGPAAVAVGEEVAALVGLGCCFGHCALAF